MKIENEHLYHGAALTQIAEDPSFTAINSLSVNGSTSRSAYRINNDIGVYFKYAGKPSNKHGEYVFNFSEENRSELAALSGGVKCLFVVFVCVKGREICCVELATLTKMFLRRRKAKGQDEDQISILVTMPKGKRFRVYVNAPGKKNTILGEVIRVARNNFPTVLFG